MLAAWGERERANIFSSERTIADLLRDCRNLRREEDKKRATFSGLARHETSFDILQHRKRGKEPRRNAREEFGRWSAR